MFKNLRFLSWLLTAFLLLGQEAAVLHHLGHDLRALASQEVATAAVGSPLGDPAAPGSDAADSVCALCVGFGTGVALTSTATFDFDGRFLAVARPAGDPSVHRPVAATGILIRGPPARFSTIA